MLRPSHRRTWKLPPTHCAAEKVMCEKAIILRVNFVAGWLVQSAVAGFNTASIAGSPVTLSCCQCLENKNSTFRSEWFHVAPFGKEPSAISIWTGLLTRDFSHFSLHSDSCCSNLTIGSAQLKDAGVYLCGYYEKLSANQSQRTIKLMELIVLGKLFHLSKNRL